MQGSSLRAVSIQQPFAEAIITGRKSLEVRTWRTSYRGRLLIHAGLTWYGEREQGKALAFQQAKRIATCIGMQEQIASFPRGALVGVVDLVECRQLSPEEWEDTKARHWCDDAWRRGLIGWEIRVPYAFANSVPFRGALGIFSVPASVVGALLN